MKQNTEDEVSSAEIEQEDVEIVRSREFKKFMKAHFGDPPCTACIDEYLKS